ncbi:hypothetical protein [Kitasatospora sp. NPDC056273]
MTWLERTRAGARALHGTEQAPPTRPKARRFVAGAAVHNRPRPGWLP